MNYWKSSILIKNLYYKFILSLENFYKISVISQFNLFIPPLLVLKMNFFLFSPMGNFYVNQIWINWILFFISLIIISNLLFFYFFLTKFFKINELSLFQYSGFGIFKSRVLIQFWGCLLSLIITWSIHFLLVMMGFIFKGPFHYLFSLLSGPLFLKND